MLRASRHNGPAGFVRGKDPGLSARAPGPHEAIALPAALAGDERAKAEAYVRRIPGDIRTLYRGLIEERLGWTPRA